jgi:choline dehydrogenase-like flavoprotein
MLTSFAHHDTIPECDVCIVGAGPVGIALALACEKSGMSVLMLESGHDHPDPFAATLTAGHVVDAERHAAAGIAICRGLGGTSRWWGGRCVPLDDVDFAQRPHVPNAAWPIPHQEISRWYEAAASLFGIGPARFTAAPASSATFGDVRSDQLERWTPETDAGRRHRPHLANSRRITVMMGATVTELALSSDGRRVIGLTLGDINRTVHIAPRRVVLACGGLETTRLLLRAQQQRPSLFGGQDGPLGRGYMGHASGKIADLVLADPAAATTYDFFVDDGVYARRRFTLKPEAQARDRLLNIAFWIDNPPFHQSEHRNGALSLVWLALAIAPIGRRLVSEGVRVSHVGPGPHRWTRHLWNVMRSPLSTLREIAAIMHARLLSRPRRPGFLIKSSDGRYALHFLAEQAPSRESRIRLSDRKDALDLPFLDIDLRYSEADARSVLRAHELLDRSLRQAGLGRLEYRVQAEMRIASILQQAKDGFHQIGTTRMGLKPEDSVVDTECRVHGIENLYVSSSSVFPSSSQANPTFAAVALALRLAAHLADQARTSDLGAAA